MTVMLGARWDDPALDDRIRRAHARGLIDYVEINYPVPYGTDVAALGVPILAHTSSNPTCSVHDVDPSVARMVRDAAVAADSPWIGEHLTWLGSAESGSLGYQINPLFTRDFKDVAAANIGRLRAFYGRELAIELGPVYVDATDYDSEMHFLGEVARAADATIILDVTHWQIANRNIGRPGDYGLDALDRERIVELHVAGMRQGSDGFWHDSHRDLPNDDVLSWTERLVGELPGLRAVTFEHHAESAEDAFFAGLETLDRLVGEARAR